jgi:methylated-DNA-[protein]-cysteine S-methyltransferase
MKRATCFWESPAGRLRLSLDAEHLFWLGFVHSQEAFLANENGDEGAQAHFFQILDELKDYFAGNRKNFSAAMKTDGSDFQKAVWEALQAIPYGETVSYSAIAAAIGKPAAVRAVASAIGQNPISIIIPCHRVIRKDGSLGGYAGGLDRKRFLLELEKNSLFPQEKENEKS